MGRARLAFKHPGSLTLPALVPPLWAAWLPLAGLLSLLVPYLGWIWLASLVLYLGVLGGAGVVLARGQSLSVARRVPLVFAAIHFGFAWGFWKETARRIAGACCTHAHPRLRNHRIAT
jgi:hypothetical protein